MSLVPTRLRFPLLCIFIVVLPLEVLVDFNNVFFNDWVNHVWLVSYYGDFLRAHWVLPDVVHTTRIVGLTQTMFYGHVFYSIVGAMAAVVGADAAIRMVLLALFAGQFYLVKRLFESYSANLTFSTVVATLVTWSTYPLTNLYNRGAVTEFVAVCLLNMAVCALLITLSRSTPRSIALSILASMLLFTLAALTHPITGLLGGLVIAGLFLFVVVVHPDRWRVVVSGVGGGVLMLAVLSPWLYTLFTFQRDLPVDATGPLMVYPLDTFLGRISPFPFDIRSLMDGTRTSTPYLDAQICMTFVPLLVAVWLAFRPGPSSDLDPQMTPLFRRAVLSPMTARVLAAVAIVVFVYGFTISLGWLPEFVPNFITHAQYGYRLITYLNLCLLLIALAASQYYSGRSFKRDATLVGMAAAVALSFTSLVVKLTHAHVARAGSGPWHTAEERETLPPTFYSIGDYNVVSGLPESVPSSSDMAVVFEPLDGQRFGEMEPIPLVLDHDVIVKTNVSSFPWNKVLLDAHEVPKSYYKTHLSGTWPTPYVSVAVPIGEHRLEYKFTPAPTWRLLDDLSMATLAIWAFGLWALVLMNLDARRRTNDPDKRTTYRAAAGGGS